LSKGYWGFKEHANGRLISDINDQKGVGIGKSVWETVSK
jgi:hypothetical protein